MHYCLCSFEQTKLATFVFHAGETKMREKEKNMLLFLNAIKSKMQFTFMIKVNCFLLSVPEFEYKHI